MSADDLSEFFVHTVTVETMLGTNGYGEDVFAPPVVLDPAEDNGCLVEEGARLVRSSDGEQEVSTTQIYTRPTNAPLFAPNSRVTVHGKQARVISTGPNVSGPLDLPDHVVIDLTTTRR